MKIYRFSKKIICVCGVILCFCFAANTLAASRNNLTYQPAIDTTHMKVKKIVRYVPVPQPGQAMKLNVKQLPAHIHKRLVGVAAVNAANKKALRKASSSEYIDSIMNFDYMPGALYQIYCAPLSVTDLQFQMGERIISVGAGDTLRWQLSKTYSGTAVKRIEHLLIKPIDSGLTNSLVVTTSLRTYHLLLHSTSSTYMASVAWRYPDSDGIVQDFDDSSATQPADQSVNMGLNLNDLDFNYKMYLVKGKQPDWAPTMIFNDGNKTYLQFPGNMQEAPVLFVGNEGDLKAVNYRVRGNYYIIDSVVQQAQLRLGQQKQTIVQIVYGGK